MVQVEVCSDSGMRAGPDCPHTHEAWVPEASLTATSCGWCERIHCDEGCAHRVHAGCAEGEMQAASWFVLPPHQAAHYQRHHAGYEPLPPWHPTCGDMDDDALVLVQPRPNAEVYLPRRLDGDRNGVVFEASHRDPRARVSAH
jgi:penicillin-binding protein 1C